MTIKDLDEIDLMVRLKSIKKEVLSTMGRIALTLMTTLTILSFQKMKKFT